MRTKIKYLLLALVAISATIISCSTGNPPTPQVIVEERLVVVTATDEKTDESSVLDPPTVEVESPEEVTNTPEKNIDVLLIHISKELQSGYATKEALTSNGVEFEALGQYYIGQSDFSFSNYRVVVVPQFWNTKTTRALNENANRIIEFVNDGGALVVFAEVAKNCDVEYWTNSWSPFPIYIELFYKGDCASGKGNEKTLIAPAYVDHVIFSGFKDEYIQAYGAIGFQGLDSEWKVLATSDESGVPVIIEARYGEGLIIVVLPNIASHYNQWFDSTLLFDNIINYALR